MMNRQASSGLMSVGDLVRCAGDGDIIGVRAAISQHLDINTRNKLGSVAIQSAVDNKHLDVVIELLSAKADVNTRNGGGWTLLHKAAYFNAGKDMVKKLVDSKADVCATEFEGWTVLHCLANKGASGYKQESDRVEMANAFFECRAQPCLYIKDKSGDLPLAVAERYSMKSLAACFSDPKNLEVPKALELKMEDFVSDLALIDAYDKNGNTALHTSILQKRETIVQQLLSAKANIHKPNVFGYTPLHTAINVNASEAILLHLLEAGARCQEVHVVTRSTVLHYVTNSQRYDSENDRVLKTKLLLNHGAQLCLNIRDKDGNTALQCALNRLLAQLADCLRVERSF